MKNKNDKTRVVFLVIHENTWKADEVFQSMLSDDAFEPLILVVPYVTYTGHDRISQRRTLEVQNNTFKYFQNKDYEVYAACDELGDILTPIETLNPDLVFFSCPYPETINEFYRNVYKNYRCFYIPYFYMIYSWGNDSKFYSTSFFNAMWRVYLPHQESHNRAVEMTKNHSGKWFLSGYPSCERLYTKALKQNAWHDSSKNKKKLIWAPHHSIYEDMQPNLGSFLFVAEHIKELARKYKDELHISFKPHPLLKAKLDDHPDWGMQRTDDYYAFWERSGFSQLDEGEYIDLFLGSDAMIHDSSSFIVEYLFLEKPVMYIDFKNKFSEHFNLMGIKAYESCLIAKSCEDIDAFIRDLLLGGVEVTEVHRRFLESEVHTLYKSKLPSEKIIDDIKQSLGAISG